MTERATPRWLDVLWLIFLGGLALIPPIGELHKQLLLLSIGVFQLLESRIIQSAGRGGPIYVVVIKIGLATILLNHTGDATAILSPYYPIYYLPVMTAALSGGAGWKKASSTFRAMGAAAELPCPAFSTSTATAMRGASAGAKQMKRAWSLP